MSFSQHQARTSISVLANVADHQEKKYRRYIEQNEAMGSGLAMRLARGDQFEGFFGKDAVEEHRETLKVIAKDNVAKERQLKAYVSAIRVVINNASSKMISNTQQEGDQSEEPAYEFKEQMETQYATELEAIEKNSILVTQEQSYLKLLRELGEDQEEDDELAVINPSSGDAATRIKCPYSMALMEDPVRSKVCKHSFARKAIYHYLQKNKRCPVPGCLNNSMTIDELEDDPETAMRVRRYKKRESANKKAQAQSAMNMDDDDDDENEF